MNNAQVAKFTMLWTEAQPSVFAMISATVRNFADSEDIRQKVASIAVAKFNEYDESRPFGPWVIGIAHYEVLKYLRAQGTDRHEFVAESLNEIAAAFETVSPELHERRHALVQCVKLLQGRSRDVLMKRYADGLKTGAIAKLMGLTPGNVSVILNRAYEKLRNCVDKRIATEGTQ